MQVYLNESQSITGETLARFKENFRLLDTNKDGKLNHQEVGILFRAFGQNPTDEDLGNMLETLPTLVDFEEFVDFFKKNYRPPISEEVLVQAFQVGAGLCFRVVPSTRTGAFQRRNRKIPST